MDPVAFCIISFAVGLDPIWRLLFRAVDPHSFFADPDLADFLNADPGPGPA